MTENPYSPPESEPKSTPPPLASMQLNWRSLSVLGLALIVVPVVVNRLIGSPGGRYFEIVAALIVTYSIHKHLRR